MGTRLQRRGRVAACALGILSLTGCGAVTGLRGPDPDAGLRAPDAEADAVPPAPDVCAVETLRSERHTSEVIFVIDRSGSMGSFLHNRSGGDTRWDALHEALARTLPAYEGTVAMGAVFYPAESGECRDPLTVAVAPALRRGSDIVAYFESTRPNGPTPTASAVRFAGSQLSAPEPRAQTRSLVLATDGEPTCDVNYDPVARTIESIGDLARRGVPTYVIGIADGGGSDAAARSLDRMAVAGGRPNARGPHSYYSALRMEELVAALSTIQQAIVSCTFVTSSPPAAPERARVSINGAAVPRDPSHRDGWDWTATDRGELAFFGAACTRAVDAPDSITVETRCDASP